MFLMKLGLYLGLAFALLGVVILRVELPRIYKTLSSLLDADDERAIRVWTVSRDANRLSLERNVLKCLNYRELNGLWSGKWDVLWSVEYPFHRYKDHLRSLHTHQRINHFPGMSHLTIKKYLATKFRHYDFIPRGFTFPSMKNDFLAFAAEHRPPDTRRQRRFVEKNWNNRGVKLVRNINEINFETFNAREKFVQEFVEHPFLIDNRIFDIGIYVLVTSFDPLRAYRFDKEILLRFCSEDYHPFNQENTKQYVVDDDSVYVWNIKSLQNSVLRLNYTAKASLELYMKQSGHDMTDVWDQMDDAITKLLLDNERDVIKEARTFGRPSQNFFELLRFDFILDASMKVHLIEINLSPHLSTSKDFANIKRNYRSQLMYDVLNLVVGGESKTSEFDFIFSDARDVAIPSRAVMHTSTCPATTSGANEECGVCMTESETQIVHRSYREHVRRGGRMKRIFPAFKHYNDHDLITRASAANRFLIKWFSGMCRVNQEWC